MSADKSNRDARLAPGATLDREIEDAASAWLAKKDRGFSEVDATAFNTWMKADKRHAEAFSRCTTTWSSLPNLRRLPDEKLAELYAPRRNSRLPISTWVWSSAAACAATIAILAWN